MVEMIESYLTQKQKSLSNCQIVLEFENEKVVTRHYCDPGLSHTELTTGYRKAFKKKESPKPNKSLRLLVQIYLSSEEVSFR